MGRILVFAASIIRTAVVVVPKFEVLIETNSSLSGREDASRELLSRKEYVPERFQCIRA